MNQHPEHLSPERVHKARIQALWIGGVLFVVLLLAAYYAYVVRKPATSSSLVTSPTPTATVAGPTPTFSPAPSTSPTPTVTPTASASPTAPPSVSPTPTSIALVPSIKAFIANFYAGYEAQDRARLEATFAPDTDPNIQDLRQSLFVGPNGPTLFISSNFMEKVTGYSVIAAAQSGSNWVVTVSEQRIGGDGSRTPARTTIITLAPADQNSGGWLVTTYVHTGSTGKYNGFITQ